jgi:hypothetical protein
MPDELFVPIMAPVVGQPVRVKIAFERGAAVAREMLPIFEGSFIGVATKHDSYSGFIQRPVDERGLLPAPVYFDYQSFRDTMPRDLSAFLDGQSVKFTLREDQIFHRLTRVPTTATKPLFRRELFARACDMVVVPRPEVPVGATYVIEQNLIEAPQAMPSRACDHCGAPRPSRTQVKCAYCGTRYAVV